MINSNLLKEAIEDAKTVRATALAGLKPFTFRNIPPLGLGTFQVKYGHGIEITRSIDWKPEWDDLKVGDIVEVEVSSEETGDFIITDIMENKNFTVPIPSTKKIFILKPYSQ